MVTLGGLHEARLLSSMSPAISMREFNPMWCLATIGLKTDAPYWIPRDTFLRLFDRQDFEFRDNLNVAPVLRHDWFQWPKNGLPLFILPTVQFVNGKTQFINGRHRTAVLIERMACLPLSLAMPFRMRPDELAQVTRYPLDQSQPFQLPEFEIVKSHR